MVLQKGRCMKTRWKILITIALACLWFWFAQTREHAATNPTLTISELHLWFNAFDDEYFNGRLPKDTVIDYTEFDDRWMATTDYWESDQKFHIRLNKKWTAASRVSLETLLHESCHIETWHEDALHGSRWRNCMLRLDRVGAFRELIIDDYTEEK